MAAAARAWAFCCHGRSSLSPSRTLAAGISPPGSVHAGSRACPATGTSTVAYIEGIVDILPVPSHWQGDTRNYIPARAPVPPSPGAAQEARYQAPVTVGTVPVTDASIYSSCHFFAACRRRNASGPAAAVGRVAASRQCSDKAWPPASF